MNDDHLPQIHTVATTLKSCFGCGSCASVCPQDTIAMKTDGAGFPYPEVDINQCIGCGLCTRACQAKQTYRNNDSRSHPRTMWAMAKERDVRLASSSGGVFALLARDVILSDGVVFGAVLTDKCATIKHRAIDNLKDLPLLAGSKYAQSIIGTEIYEEVYESLIKRKLVLFSGTGCQVSAVRRYAEIKKLSTDNLLLVEVVCHGVPSPALWKKWSKSFGTLTNVNFRDKRTGWEDYSVTYSLGKSEITRTRESDWYMRAFMAGASLRESCFDCKFKPSGISDLLLGDYWGIYAVHPYVDRSGGVSLVIANTLKGADAIERIKHDLLLGDSSFEEAVKYNKSLVESTRRHPRYVEFINDVSILDVEEMVRKWPFAVSAKAILKRRLAKAGRITVSRLRGFLNSKQSR